MNVLLLRPDPGNERFGLGPFFRVEPLGLEYVAESLLEGQPWFKYDMHHVLWEPRLGARRFFELYAETWRRAYLDEHDQSAVPVPEIPTDAIRAS